jgi:hypothetical protein
MSRRSENGVNYRILRRSGMVVLERITVAATGGYAGQSRAELLQIHAERGWTKELVSLSHCMTVARG